MTASQPRERQALAHQVMVERKRGGVVVAVLRLVPSRGTRHATGDQIRDALCDLGAQVRSACFPDSPECGGSIPDRKASRAEAAGHGELPGYEAPDDYDL